MSTFNNNNVRLRLAALALCAFQILFASAADTIPIDPATVALRQALQQRYPNTQFGDIQRTPMAGIWEVWMGANVAYVTDDARHFLFGHLVDMQTQADLTAAKQEGLAARQAAARPKIGFADLPLDDAIKTVRGNGRRQLAVFSDPDCPYCRQLEGELDKLDDVTIYTFLFPIASLHPDAMSKSEAIWCAKDRALAWKSYLSTGRIAAKPARCASPIERNIELAARAGIQGTPFLFFANGEKAAGALDLASLESHLPRN